MPASRRARVLRRLVHPLYRRLEKAARPLRYLFLEITQRCNLRCRHCGSDCGREPREGELSTKEWTAFLEYVGGNFDPKELLLVVTGGEPFCHPHFDRILGALGASGIPWGMVTNGYALSAKSVRRLVDARIASVTLSVDGLRESHDWLRGVPGSFERAMAGARVLAGSGIPFFDVVTCVGPRNLGELPRLGELLREADVPAWRLFSIFPKGRAKGDPELILPPEGLRALLDFIRRRRSESSRSGFRIDFCCEGYLPAPLDRAVRDEPYFCRAGISIGSVLCDGSISACPNIARSLVQGNIRTDDFKTVWDERFEPFRRREWMRTGACVGCREWKRCQGNSMHLWDDEVGRTALCTFEAVRGT